MNINFESRSGRELELMLAGKKPMASFYRYTHEKFDEFSGQDFDKYVNNYIFRKKIFFIQTEIGKIIYTTFATINESWRLDLYKTIKKIDGVWNEDLELIESFLLNFGKL
ncbi:MAG: hypothetical protein IPN84_16365 [Sphingomonadales bacterium]|nr:hypothetical protein [Sphingomonadales bacterium]